MAAIRRRQAIAVGLSLAISPQAECFAETHFDRRADLDEFYDKQTDEAICTGLDLLIARQNPDGTFRSSEHGRWVGICSLVGLAWLSRGVRYGYGTAGTALLRTGDYVLSKVQASGFLSAKETSHGPMYDHGFGTLFLAELYGATTDNGIRDKLSAAVKLIVRSQNERTGGWRYHPASDDADLSVTVSQLMALRAARNAGIGVPKETIDRAVEYVRKSQNPDGGFMYQITGDPSRFALTAAAIVALYNAGIYQGKEIDLAFEYLEANMAANRTVEADNFFFYAHYYSAQAFRHHGGQRWQTWYGYLKKSVLSQRNQQGVWFDLKSVEYATAMACLILNMPRTVLPIFQR
ncbi:MAG: terpene cyclase/mutase family protein [Planctomycetales bacterium]|nr:terpene cyclase/mutase family protein [Planctomycetales bacterium]